MGLPLTGHRVAAPPLRAFYLAATIGLTALSFAVAIALAPAADARPVRALTWLLFVGSSVHVAATGWFFTVPEVRAFARKHPRRYVAAPAVLVGLTAVVAAIVTPRHFTWLLLAFFAWQFFHFQKQNLGMAALAGVGQGAGSLRPAERHAITAAGVGGIVALIAHPELLQVRGSAPARWCFFVGAALFGGAVAAGGLAFARRAAARRPAAFTAVYVQSLLFFLPVFFFSSPYAAVAGLTLAHGFQYLLIVGLVARGQQRGGAMSLAVLLNVALVGGIALNLASHLHDGGTAARLVFGGYLGLVMAHFVIDAGLWRLREEFPRAFLTSALPYLLVR
jgi:hypothetical protein